MGLEQRTGGNPLRLKAELELGSRVLQRFLGGLMGMKRGVKVAQNPDANSVLHGVILMEKAATCGQSRSEQVRSVVTGSVLAEKGAGGEGKQVRGGSIRQLLRKPGGRIQDDKLVRPTAPQKSS